jgi:phytoene synthase
MTPILGAWGPDARRAAIHLGIAMQMTNIARDVLEDAQNGRRYLPGSWVNHLSAHAIESSASAREPVAHAVGRLLDLADLYYASAATGFALIPAHTRKGIEIAATVYRQIGVKLRRRHLAWWQGRVRVSLCRKLWIAVNVYVRSSSMNRAFLPGSVRQRSTGHDAERLSLPLAGLPGVQ